MGKTKHNSKAGHGGGGAHPRFERGQISAPIPGSFQHVNAKTSASPLVYGTQKHEQEGPGGIESEITSTQITRFLESRKEQRLSRMMMNAAATTPNSNSGAPKTNQDDAVPPQPAPTSTTSAAANDAANDAAQAALLERRRLSNTAGMVEKDAFLMAAQHHHHHDHDHDHHHHEDNAEVGKKEDCHSGRSDTTIILKNPSADAQTVLRQDNDNDNNDVDVDVDVEDSALASSPIPVVFENNTTAAADGAKTSGHEAGWKQKLRHLASGKPLISALKKAMNSGRTRKIQFGYKPQSPPAASAKMSCESSSATTIIVSSGDPKIEENGGNLEKTAAPSSKGCKSDYNNYYCLENDTPSVP